MEITQIRIATEVDAKAIAEIANEHELSVDSKSTLFSERAALDFISGYVDSSVTYLLTVNNEPDFSAVVNLHPDSVKRRYFTDVYAKPRLETLDVIVGWSIDLAESENPDWEIWPGANFLDKRLQSAWTNHGFEFLRRYYTMRMQISSAPTISTIPGVEIKTIDIDDPDLVVLWHKVHQDSFSQHFGFVPRELEKWRDLVIKDVFIDRSGVFMAFKNGEPIGFCECSDEYADENKGYISILGVAQEHQGFGIGEALLQTGISHCASKGFTSMELNVDTGNESGALKLYEKVGLKPESSWIQLHRPKS
jgi:ribosomal protein S18 acetylase RimI-like enzyme